MLITKNTNVLKIGIIGDSIAEGYTLDNPVNDCYPSKLQLKLGNEYQVLNFGKSSHCMMKNSVDGKSYWKTDQWTLAKKSNLDLYIINLGLNDAKPNNWINGNNNFISSYIAMIDELRALPSKPIIYCSYPSKSFLPCIGKNQAQQMNYINVISFEKNSPIIDLFCQTSLLDSETYFTDGLHPNKLGADIIADIIYKYLINHK